MAAIDAAGNQSGLSNIASATIPPPDLTPPTAPTGLTATFNATTNAINLSWTASNRLTLALPATEFSATAEQHRSIQSPARRSLILGNQELTVTRWRL